MYVLGHLGIGYALVESLPATRKLKLPVLPLLLGTVLPDLIDKTLYYAVSSITGKRGYELGILAGTRNFGHTLLFFIALLSLALYLHAKPWLAVALGVLTHQLLDLISDLVITKDHLLNFRGFFWPLFGWYFPEMPFSSFSAQIGYWMQPFPLVCEGVGAVFLLIILVRKKRPRHL